MGTLIIFLVKNSLIVQSVYILNCQASIHVVLNCIFNFTYKCMLKELTLRFVYLLAHLCEKTPSLRDVSQINSSKK